MRDKNAKVKGAHCLKNNLAEKGLIPQIKNLAEITGAFGTVRYGAFGEIRRQIFRSRFENSEFA
jgi:hypothetical protein